MMYMIHDVPVTELRVGDWPISIDGFRPIQALKVRPRKGQVIVTIADDKHTFHRTHIVRKVYRTPQRAVPMPATNNFPYDPEESQVR